MPAGPLAMPVIFLTAICPKLTAVVVEPVIAADELMSVSALMSLCAHWSKSVP